MYVMNNEPKTEPFLCGNVVHDKTTFYLSRERMSDSINCIETTDDLKEKQEINIYIHMYISLHLSLYPSVSGFFILQATEVPAQTALLNKGLI